MNLDAVSVLTYGIKSSFFFRLNERVLTCDCLGVTQSGESPHQDCHVDCFRVILAINASFFRFCELKNLNKYAFISRFCSRLCGYWFRVDLATLDHTEIPLLLVLPFCLLLLLLLLHNRILKFAHREKWTVDLIFPSPALFWK